MKNIIIFGNSNFAKLMHHYVTTDGGWEVEAFTVDKNHIDSEEFCQLPLVPFEELKNRFPPQQYKILVALGYSNLNKSREQVFERVKKAGYELVSFIHPTAHVSKGTIIGDNCIILEQTTVHPFVELGDDIIIWSNVIVGHNATVEDHAFIASGVLIGSYVSIGRRSFLGGGCIINPYVKLGEDCILGIGTLVMEDAKSGSVFKAPADTPRKVSSSRVKIQ